MVTWITCIAIRIDPHSPTQTSQNFYGFSKASDVRLRAPSRVERVSARSLEAQDPAGG